MADPLDRLIDQLTDIRKRNGWSLHDVARRMGHESAASLSQWEGRKKRPISSHLLAWVDAVGYMLVLQLAAGDPADPGRLPGCPCGLTNPKPSAGCGLPVPAVRTVVFRYAHCPHHGDASTMIICRTCGAEVVAAEGHWWHKGPELDSRSIAAHVAQPVRAPEAP